MAGKVHKTLRLEKDLVDRVEALRNEGEATSSAMTRIIAVGCDCLERGTDCGTGEHSVAHDVAQPVAQPEHDESTAKLIERLETDIERLTLEHEADRAAIADKDEQLARALERAHDLAHQAHVLIGMEKTEALPSADGQGTTEAAPKAEAEQKPKKISFREWWRNYR